MSYQYVCSFCGKFGMSGDDFSGHACRTRQTTTNQIPPTTKISSSPQVFSPSDFDPGGPPAEDGQFLCTYEWAARTANRILRERSTVVYGIVGEDGRMGFNAEALDAYDTHTALLVNVQPIAKPDTADSLVRDLVKAIESDDFSPLFFKDLKNLQSAYLAAKKFLGNDK